MIVLVKQRMHNVKKILLCFFVIILVREVLLYTGAGQIVGGKGKRFVISATEKLKEMFSFSNHVSKVDIPKIEKPEVPRIDIMPVEKVDVSQINGFHDQKPQIPKVDVYKIERPWVPKVNISKQKRFRFPKIDIPKQERTRVPKVNIPKVR
ncbi:hypothetical protein KAI68_08315 [bacterium]|nr:hypothetical protein [bacterium]